MGLGLSLETSNLIGIGCALAALIAFLALGRKPIAGAPDIDSV